VPPEVWNEVTSAPKPFGTNEARQARDAGWLIVRAPTSLAAVQALPFNLQPGESEALALAVELADALLLVDDAQGRRAGRALGINYTGTLGVLLRAKAEGKLAALRPSPRSHAETNNFLVERRSASRGSRSSWRSWKQWIVCAAHVNRNSSDAPLPFTEKFLRFGQAPDKD
jgi:predicted nucleic acid-binding protein